jgi:solute:Na+ symporter, SSS family
MAILDTLLFVTSVLGVITLGIWASKRGQKADGETGAADYFLAGRGLTWWLVGFSLIAANISTEQFVGMSGKSADWLGMAIASYEWMAAITLVVVAFVFLPKLLKTGIYTIPEFLEYRYGKLSRAVMAVATLVILVGVPTASVIFSGAKVVSVAFPDTPILGSLPAMCWIIGTLAATYVFVGGLKACAWTDLVWGSALILGGAIIAYLAFGELASRDANELIATKVATSDATVADLEAAGGWERFVLLNKGEAVDGPNGAGGKLHMVRSKDDPEIPWTALILGLWIPNFFYWGLNQYIVQRTLGSKSLAEGQKGVVFAAFLKLIIPFVVVIPGILAFNLFSGDLKSEADRKNEAVIAELSTAPAKVFPFSPEFADVNPAVASQMFQHNLAQFGADADPFEMDVSSLAASNDDLVNRAKADGIPAATLAIGYDYDAAFGTLLRNLLFPGIRWFVFAAITGAVISSLASMLNSASTIATMDIYAKLKQDASNRQLVTAGRCCVVAFVLVASIIAPTLGSPAFSGIFTFIQEFQGFISAGILAAFLFGFLVPKAPRYFGWVAIVANVVLYGFFKWIGGPLLVSQGLWFSSEMAFLDRLGLCFVLIVLVGAVATMIHPLKEPVKMPEIANFDATPSKTAQWGGIAVILGTLTLYAIFW